MDISWLFGIKDNIYFFLLAYSILGAGIKYIDSAFDELTANKTIAMILAPLLGILWAYTMVLNAFSATILLAVMLGVLLKGKLDNYAHVLGFSVIVVIITLAKVELMILPLIFLSAAAVLDELGNDTTDNNTKHVKNKKFRDRLALYFFGRRYMLKAAVLFLVLINVFPMFYLLAIIFFDEAYIMTALYSHSKQKGH